MKSVPCVGLVMKYVIIQRVAIGPTFSCCINDRCLKVCVRQDKRSQQMDCFIFVVQCEGTVKKGTAFFVHFYSPWFNERSFLSTYGLFSICLYVSGSSRRLVSMLRALNIDFCCVICALLLFRTDV
jgi:hypothetical protein